MHWNEVSFHELLDINVENNVENNASNMECNVGNSE